MIIVLSWLKANFGLLNFNSNFKFTLLNTDGKGIWFDG